MHDILLVAVVNYTIDLNETVKNVLFTQLLTVIGFCALAQVSSFRIIHHDAEFGGRSALPLHKGLYVFDDVGVVEGRHDVHLI